MDKIKLIEQIKQLKGEDTLILAHTYQPPEIIDAADITGDSFALSVAASKTQAKRVIMCGVRFMAETVKILSPEKQVILAAPQATCPMADQISPERVRKFKEENPDIPVVVYINTNSALKAECDVCVTSSSAVKIVSQLPQKDILFIPDQNLGAWVQKKLPDKNIILWDGFCPIHSKMTASDVLSAKAEHPKAKLAMHPECPAEALQYADVIGSTKAIIDFALSTDEPVILGTERGVADYLIEKYPEKQFYHLCPDRLICPDMKMTTLDGLLECVKGNGGEEIVLDPQTSEKAAVCIDNMLKYGG
ncbi:MAG: quinolinate synthase NadA [Clostridia bacterium]|nr:quinolinate synthase NadA [Clostridia bacterium]